MNIYEVRTPAQLLGGNLGLNAKGLSVDDIGRGNDGQRTRRKKRRSRPILPIRSDHLKPVCRRQLEKLCEGEHGEALVVVGLCGSEATVGKRGLLL